MLSMPQVFEQSLFLFIKKPCNTTFRLSRSYFDLFFYLRLSPRMLHRGPDGEAQVLLVSPKHEHELEGLVIPAVAAVEGGAPAEQHVGQLGRLYVEKIIRINLKIESFCELFMYQIVVRGGNWRIFVKADHEEAILNRAQDLIAGGIWFLMR